MSDDIIEFRSLINRQGYRWVETRSIDRPEGLGSSTPDAGLKERSQNSDSRPRLFLTDGVPIGEDSGAMDVRYPLRDLQGRLHRVFAQTSPTKEGILEFANSFGCLGEPSFFIPIESRLERKDTATHLGWGEWLQDWQTEIRQLSLTIRVWDWIQENNEQALSNHLNWDENRVTFFWDADGGEIFISVFDRRTRPHIYELFEKGDLIGPAKILVQNRINAFLYDKGRVGPRVIYDVQKKALEYRLVPNSLSGAIWLDLLNAVNGNVRYRRCENCGSAFPSNTQGQKKRFCSDSCRVANHRSRKSPKASS